MPKKKKKNLDVPFALLLFISFPLALFMIYISFTILSTIINRESGIQQEKPKVITDIPKPSYAFTPLQIDTDLSKFPSDYDTLVESLRLTLTQHQKTTLLLYGETISKTKHTNITDAYKELIEKETPILIPQEYINQYLNDKIGEYEKMLTESVSQLDGDLVLSKTDFRNIYDEYIYKQASLQIPLQEKSEAQSSDSSVSNFLIDLNSENINDAYYKLRVLNFLSKDINTHELVTLLNNLVIYSQNPNDLNTNNQLKTELKNIIFNSNLNRQGNIYWKITVIEGKSYLYPMYISEEFVVNDSNFNEPYDVTPLAQSSKSVRVPILMYHHIDAMPNSTSRFVTGLYVTPETFEEQLAYLVKKNYKSITSQELYNLLSKGLNPTQKTVMITFDDSTKGQYTNGYPLLKKYGLVGVFYVVSNKTSITYNQLREMARNGMIIDSHSASHIDLAKENNQERLYSEIVGSRYTLKSATGQDVFSIAYPGCVADSDAYSYVAQAGYLIGGSCGRSIDHYYSKRFSLSRTHVFNSLDSLKNILSGKQ